MAETPGMSIYEKKFAKSDETDAILLVDGKKLHVNKELLSCHSDYFKTLFNSDFKGNSMEEIPIEDVNFADFATVLSLVHSNRIEPTTERIHELLKIADRFQLPSAKQQLEEFLKTTNHHSDGQRCKSYTIQELVMSCNFNNAALAQFAEMAKAVLERAIENEKANDKKPQ